MTPKIKELAEQTGMLKRHGEYCFEEEDLSKFAELIVLECANKLKTMALAYDGLHYGADYVSGIYDSIDIIEEHFGIENEQQT